VCLTDIAKLRTRHRLVQGWARTPPLSRLKPFKVELVGGKKQPFCDGKKDIWLCGCKHTSNPPYCDGTHKQDFIVSAPLHEPAES
uniref:Iron-binding zinc finger CDGSH type domain-containing protein n=1 Tax=Maylandia zebra TaxID=106582 RepID=A0A3P9CIM1_9CICH